MITLKGRVLTFTGKDKKLVAKQAKEYGMSFTNFVTGLLWELIMRTAREKNNALR